MHLQLYNCEEKSYWWNVMVMKGPVVKCIGDEMSGDELSDDDLTYD